MIESIMDFFGFAWLLLLTIAVLRLWDRSGIDQEQEQLEDDWQPVDLTDEREFELEEQQKRKQWYQN